MITQQAACYDAEGALERGRVFETIEDVQRFVDSLRDKQWWTAQGYARSILRIEVAAAPKTVKRSTGRFDKEMNAGLLTLTQGGMCMRVVLHEVAHVIAAVEYGSKSHDPWWARTYLTLVSCVMGTDAYLTLQRSFDAHGVDYDVRTTPAHVIIL